MAAVKLSFDLVACRSIHPPVLVLHGLFGSKQNWKSLGKRISSSLQRSVYTIDLRNHGSSPHAPHSYPLMALDIQEFQKQHNLGKVDLIGHSMGGKVVMQLLLDHEKFINRAVVVDIGPHSAIPSEFLNYLDMMRTIEASEMDSKAANAYFLKNIPDTGVVNFLMTNFKVEKGNAKFRINLDALEQFDINHAMPSSHSDIPVLFIKGSTSAYIEPNATFLNFSKSQLIELRGGHWIHAEQPTEFVAAISKFLQ